MAGLPGTYPVPFVLYRVFLHASLETLFQSAKPTLVPFILVNHAAAVETALKNHGTKSQPLETEVIIESLIHTLFGQ